jgi:uncharacterized phosphosugar-binding protein
MGTIMDNQQPQRVKARPRPGISSYEDTWCDYCQKTVTKSDSHFMDCIDAYADGGVVPKDIDLMQPGRSRGASVIVPSPVDKSSR